MNMKLRHALLPWVQSHTIYRRDGTEFVVSDNQAVEELVDVIGTAHVELDEVLAAIMARYDEVYPNANDFQRGHIEYENRKALREARECGYVFWQEEP